MSRKNADSINSKDIITYQSVGKILIPFLKQEFKRLMSATPDLAAWTAEGFLQVSIMRLLDNDILRPSTDYMYESEVRTKANQVALSLFHEVTLGAKPDDAPILPELELLKLIDAYLKKVQEEQKSKREQTLRGTARTLSKEELAAYAPVVLSSQSVKAFTKEVENRLKRKT